MFNQFEQRKKYYLHIPLLIYWIILFILTSIPTDALPSPFGISDKLEHFAAYFVLSFLMTLTLYFREKNDWFSKHYLIAGVLISSFYGVFDEIHQFFIPGRYCEFYDFLANVLGTLTGSSLVFHLLKTHNQK
ncbi:VanZ family protein [Bacteroidota bacterium]